MRSLLWAISKADSNTIVSSFSPEHQALAQKTWKEIFQPSLALMKRQIDQTQGFQILSQKETAKDTVLIDLYSKGRQRSRQYSFQKIKDDWKCNRIWSEKAFLQGSE